MNKLLILGYAVGAIGIIVMLIDFWKDLVENPIPTVVILGIFIFICYLNSWKVPGYKRDGD